MLPFRALAFCALGLYPDWLLQYSPCLKAGTEHVHLTCTLQLPVYSFKESRRVGTTTQPVPPSRVVIIEGIYALSERLKPLLDLRGDTMQAVLHARCIYAHRTWTKVACAWQVDSML